MARKYARKEAMNYARKYDGKVKVDRRDKMQKSRKELLKKNINGLGKSLQEK